ncbi:MAG: efflux RND transporter periplasmic adaptor subunit [Saprospiraceae bacterium]|nr:efflux RND transporter periplasmic adaptor subunit [Saprospiraceae bacterium]
MQKLILLIVPALIIYISCKQQSAPEIQPVNQTSQLISVMLAPVESSKESDIISAPGVVKSESEAMPSFKTGGIIASTYVKEGDFVRKGQLLARLVLTEIDAQVSQAEESLIKTQRDFDRVNNLYKDSVATLEQLQNITSALVMAKNTAEIARFNRSYSEVKAPINGRVVKQIMRTGEIAGPGMPVFAILGTQSSDWKITTGLTDKDWARLKTGDTAEVEFDAWPGKKYPAVIKEKTSVAGAGSGRMDVTLKLKTQPTDMAAGMLCNVFIKPSNKENLILIPIEALVKTNGNKAWVYTIENGNAKKISIQTGNIYNDKISVLSGLDLIKEVVTVGSVYLEEGDRVQIVNK